MDLTLLQSYYSSLNIANTSKSNFMNTIEAGDGIGIGDMQSKNFIICIGSTIANGDISIYGKALSINPTYTVYTYTRNKSFNNIITKQTMYGEDDYVISRIGKQDFNAKLDDIEDLIDNFNP